VTIMNKVARLAFLCLVSFSATAGIVYAAADRPSTVLAPVPSPVHDDSIPSPVAAPETVAVPETVVAVPARPKARPAAKKAPQTTRAPIDCSNAPVRQIQQLQQGTGSVLYCHG
jgi:hypothetical protein